MNHWKEFEIFLKAKSLNGYSREVTDQMFQKPSLDCAVDKSRSGARLKTGRQ